MASKKKTTKKKASAKATAKKATAKKATAKKAPTKKKVTKRAVAAKKTPTQKAPAKKVPAKKTPAKKKAAAKKAPAKKVPAKKKAAAKKAPAKKKPPAKKVPVKKKAPAKKTVVNKKAVTKKAASAPAPRKRAGKHLAAKDLKQFKQLLLNLRDRVVDEISFLAGDNLNSVQLERTGEEGTDNFNREFALKLVSSEQDIIYEIDEALRRIRQGTYGICEISGEPIEKARLEVMPHARHSVKVQSELEKGRARYRPFGPTISRS